MGDVQGDGFLNFDAFISVIATHLKVEHLDAMIEEDFLRLVGTVEKDITSMSDDDKIHLSCDWKMLQEAAKTFGGKSLSDEACQEMVFDADIDAVGNGSSVSLDELITCLEMVRKEEIVEKRESMKSMMWRRP